MSGDFEVMTDLAARLAAERLAERADFLAYLKRRGINARTLASATPESDELHALAADRARQVEVIAEEIRAGLHEDRAAVEAELAEGALGLSGEEGEF